MLTSGAPAPPVTQGKDVFEAFYKRDLAKRLLLGKSASIDSEKVRARAPPLAFEGLHVACASSA